MLHSRRVLVDTNLLVLWIYGTVAPSLVGTGRTSSYTLDDYYLLSDYFEGYEEFLITPGVAAEVSNLIGKLHGDHLKVARSILGSQLQLWKEDYVPSSELSRSAAFTWAGLTDVGIRAAAGQGITVLTDDLPLYGWLLNEGVHAINFNHIRFPQ